MILQALGGLRNEMDGMYANMHNKMDGMTQTMRGEMQKMGHGLQAGIMAFASEVRTTVDKRAPPRAATNELKGSAPAGEDRVIRETCTVTEEAKVTVTRRKKLNGVTETCTARREVTELTKTRETVEERLHGVEEKDGVKDAHTHTHR